MTAAFDEEALRHWLADYLVTTIGCSPEEIDFDSSLSDLGVGSRDAVVLCGELSELLGRKVSPVELWQHPSVTELARFLIEPESADDDAVPEPGRFGTDEPIAVIGLGCRFPGDINSPDAFWQFLLDGGNAVSEVPADRWAPFDDGSPETGNAIARTTRWGSFLNDIAAFDAEFFDISSREAVKMDPSSGCCWKSPGRRWRTPVFRRRRCGGHRPACTSGPASPNTAATHRRIWTRWTPGVTPAVP